MTAKRAKPRKRAAKKKKAPAARSPETIDTLLDCITRKGKARLHEALGRVVSPALSQGSETVSHVTSGLQALDEMLGDDVEEDDEE